MAKSPELLSIIIRFHDERRLSLLEQALFSLAVQDYPKLEIIVAVQNGSEALSARLEGIFSHLPFIGSTHRILPVTVAEGQDGRSMLLNQGIQAAEGRFLAFLDYDDVMYQHAYSLMLSRMKECGAAIVVAGCRKAHQQSLESDYFIQRKEHYQDKKRNKFDLFAENFIPFHSFVIDRKTVKQDDLAFDETLSCYEDYLFLLNLAAKYSFDFALLDKPVAEYRIRTDGTNSIPAYSDCSAKQQAWDSAKAKVDKVKEELITQVTVAEIAALVAERNYFESKAQGQFSADKIHQIIQQLRQIIRRYPRLKSALLTVLMTAWKIKKQLIR